MPNIATSWNNCAQGPAKTRQNVAASKTATTYGPPTYRRAPMSANKITANGKYGRNRQNA
eukprot:9415258-Lingulodinium_polyedra.AAC.1